MASGPIRWFFDLEVVLYHIYYIHLYIFIYIYSVCFCWAHHLTCRVRYQKRLHHRPGAWTVSRQLSEDNVVEMLKK